MQVHTHTYARTRTGVFQGEFCRCKLADAHAQVFQGEFWTRRTNRRLYIGVSRQNSYSDRLAYRLAGTRMDVQSVSRRMQRLVDAYTDTGTCAHASGVFQGKRAQTNTLTLADTRTDARSREGKHFNANKIVKVYTLARAYLHTRT